MVFRTYSDEVGVATDTGSNRTFTAAEAISQGQLVKLDTDDSARTVEPSDTDGESAYGFAAYDATAGQEVLVYGATCVVRATSGTGTISSGDRVASHGGTGEEGEVDTAASGDIVVGVALEDDTGANDDVIVEVVGIGGEVA